MPTGGPRWQCGKPSGAAGVRDSLQRGADIPVCLTSRSRLSQADTNVCPTPGEAARLCGKVLRDRQVLCPVAVWRSRSCGTRACLFFQPFRTQSETAKGVFSVAVSLGGRGGLAVSRSGNDHCSSEHGEPRTQKRQLVPGLLGPMLHSGILNPFLLA